MPIEFVLMIVKGMFTSNFLRFLIIFYDMYSCTLWLQIYVIHC